MIRIAATALTAAIIGLAAVLAASFGAYQALLPSLGAPGAAALTAVGLFLLVLGCIASMLLAKRRSSGSREFDPTTLLALQAGRELADILRVHPYLGSGCSALLGFALGANPDLRRTVMRLLLKV